MKSATQATITPEQQEKLNALLLRAAQNREGEVFDPETQMTYTVAGLLKQGADVNAADQWGDTPLRRAARIGNAKIVEALLAIPDVNVNAADRRGSTPIICAAEDGHTEIVTLLLAIPNVNVNAADQWGDTPLRRAAIRGHTEIAKLLLARPDVDVNIVDQTGNTPLRWAAINGHTETVNQIITHTATSQRNDGQDWVVMREELNKPQILNKLNLQTASLLAVIMPEGDLRNLIIANFNGRNPDAQLDQGEIDGLRNLRSCHIKYLGMAEGEGNGVANERSFALINDPEKKAAALAQNRLIEELASWVIRGEAAPNIHSLALHQPREPQMESLLSVAENPEEIFRLKDLIVAHNSNEKVPSLQTLSFLAALDTMVGRIQLTLAEGSQLPSPAPSAAPHTEGSINIPLDGVEESAAADVRPPEPPTRSPEVVNTTSCSPLMQIVRNFFSRN